MFMIRQLINTLMLKSTITICHRKDKMFANEGFWLFFFKVRYSRP